MTTLQEHNAAKLQEFLETIRPWCAAYVDATFGFIGLRREDDIEILQGHLILPSGGPTLPSKYVETENVVAGIYRLVDFKQGHETVLHQLIEVL